MAEDVCIFGEKHLEKCITANAKLNEIADSKDYMLADPGIAKLNASIVAANATEDVKLHLAGLQEALGVYADAACKANNQIIGSLKKITGTITADDDCLTYLVKLNETNSLESVPCEVAYRFENVSSDFERVASELHQYYKKNVLPNYDYLVQQVGILSEDLKINPNLCDHRIIELTSRLQSNMNFLKFIQLDVEDFMRRASQLAFVANKHFTEMANYIENAAPLSAA